MVDWSTIRPAMIGLIGRLSGLQTVWIDDARPFVDTTDQAIALIQLRSTEEVGIADRRYVDQQLPPPAPSLIEERHGILLVDFDIRVEAFQHDDRFAFRSIEHVRSRLAFQSTIASFRSIGMAIAKVGNAVTIDNHYTNQRITSIASLSLMTHIAFSEADSDIEHHHYTIEQANDPSMHSNTTIHPFC